MQKSLRKADRDLVERRKGSTKHMYLFPEDGATLKRMQTIK